ncbi:CO2 hydration protein [Alkalinema sp. FACHB-956]|uniref:CO2 hydration protein n=1 Tax=Alkalinema sp. FACHB-956 TaxID=2692768 RepID=UPI00168228E5|nr:CO2 hydration protein [Alkalinema sp. FACHB-956]MBD2325741.1 CO2 hydration protein [Alkalinema sp. FACHB-956]
MTTVVSPATPHPFEAVIQRLEQGQSMLPDSPTNLLEVVGILESYGRVLNAYEINLRYIADQQFLVLFPFFKYMNGDVTLPRLLKHWWHDRINYEFSEYCMKAMLWHGGGGLDAYLDSPEFIERANQAIAAKTAGNFIVQGFNKLSPEFLLEQVRQMCYYRALGQFWEIMSRMFLTLADRYYRGEIKSIPDVVHHVKDGLVADAATPITYTVNIKGKAYDIIPKSVGLTFLVDTAIPYVEAVFYRSLPFMGTLSYNAQAQQVPSDQGDFVYGALYADPIPAGGAGIPPTLLAKDMIRHLPPYLLEYHKTFGRGESDLSVKAIQSFQKSMFCVTSAAILGLAPHPWDTADPAERATNRKHFEAWVDRLVESGSRLSRVQD